MTLGSMKTKSGAVLGLVARLLLLAALAFSTLAFPRIALAQNADETWWNDQWTMRKKITIDASPTGVPIAEPIGTSPVLVRLHAGNFGESFAQTKPDGGDIRFIAGDDKTPLNFQIEKFDRENAEALIWVKVPSINPNTKTEFWLYWGNEIAPTLGQQEGKGVFDTETKLVYHFGDGSIPAQDATVWNNNSQSLVTPAPGSVIGNGAKFGADPLVIPATPTLRWENNQVVTIMGWFRMTAPQSNSVIFSRRNNAAGLIIGVDNAVPFVEVATGTGTQRTPGSAPLEPGRWYHIAVVADGTLITLYVNGAGVATLVAQVPPLESVSFLGGDTPVAVPAPAVPAEVPAPAIDGVAEAVQPPLATGEPGVAEPSAAASPDPATDPFAQPVQPTQPVQAPTFTTNPGFAGEADEFSIAFVARPQGFIRLAAIGQGGEQMGQLITYSVPQETSAWLTGTYGVLIKAVKPAEWVVIGLLGVMLLASIWVMVAKNSYVSRQAKANLRFTDRFRRLSESFDAIDHEEDLAILSETKGKQTRADRRMLRESSLYRLYEVGVREVRSRSRLQGNGRPGALTAEGLAAIRATLDATFVREIQKLRSQMIVLTIAISGGPFLGLLGTVMGVMTTFAAIALSGEVNVNSIAPGVAGALVATVAGLVVAIPALFVYNILITRVNNLTSDMQVFIDEFVTKVSEHYSRRPDPIPQRLAAE
jgi:biopolymer transport protein ExbB